jgi:hypothetical protein
MAKDGRRLPATTRSQPHEQGRLNISTQILHASNGFSGTQSDRL